MTANARADTPEGDAHADIAAPPASPRDANTRDAALRVLTAVLTARTPLDLAFERELPRGNAQRRGRAFIRHLVLTTLRRLGQIDALIDHCLERPLPNGAAPVRDALRLGVCQIVFMEVADHAAVSETVELAETVGHPRLKGLVNAVLRRLAREGPGLARGQDASRFNTPDWLWESWSAAYGEEACRAIAEAHLEEPPLDITLRDPGGAEAGSEATAHAGAEAARWAARLGGAPTPTGSIRRPNTLVEDLPGYREGAWWVQDAAAALPVRLLGEVSGRAVIDLCAAPGGKTAQLAAAGARVTAVDRSAPRMQTLVANLARLGLEAEIEVADAAIWRPETLADAVLVDAPCTATGTARRNPDVLRTKTARDMLKLARTQDRLLRAAVEMVRPGGAIVYCTCSLQPEEGPERIAALTESGVPVRRDPLVAAEIGGQADFLTPDGDLRTLPGMWDEIGGLDGFFAARLRRTEG